MDQHEGAGHHAITREGVEELFATHADSDGRVNGMTQDEYFAALDGGQEHQDRWYGPTTHPAWLSPEAQREHGMADPNMTGEENRIVDREYVEDELHAARDGDEMTHLGNVVHALEDSYSEAHAFRGASANEGDPTAPIESFNVFDPLPNPSMGTWGKISDEQGTHDERFDEVPLDANGELVRGSDIAAAHAVAQTLAAYEDNRGNPDAVAHDAMDAVVDRFYQAGDGGTTVNDEASDAWRAERDRRLAQDREELAAAGLTPPEETSWLDTVGGVVDSVVSTVVSAGEAVADGAVAAGGAIADGAVAVGEAVADGAVAVGEAVADGVSAVGEGISDAASAVGDFFSETF